jgi:hypothetical protein
MTRNPRHPLTLSLLWEIPLALLSFCFFKSVKALVGLLYGLYVRRDRNRATQWQVLSAVVVLNNPIALPVLMTKGPRWNTHAIIGTVGPFAIDKTLSLDLAYLHRSARSWTVVVYRYPDYTTMAQISALEQREATVYDLPLPPGQYSLGVRYYDCRETVVFPAVELDRRSGVESEHPTAAPIEAHAVSPDTNQFYCQLSQRHNWFYAALHYYIYTLLQLRPWLPEAFVTQEYLPVGNPDTTFFYDYVEAKQSLQIQARPAALQNYDLYFTLYSRSSLPLYYTKIEEAITTVPAFEGKGYYLVRVRPRVASAPACGPDLIKISPIEALSLISME